MSKDRTVLTIFTALAQFRLSSEVPSKGVVLFHHSSLVSSGLRLSIAQLPAGHGIRTGGFTNCHLWTSLEVDLFTSPQAGLRLRMPSFSESASMPAINHTASPTTPRWSF